MTADQIKLLRDFNSKDDGTGNRLAGSIACIFNNEVAYIDSRDYVVYDDANELVHAIRANTENPVLQAQFPFRITTGFYENVQYMEALYDMANFSKAIQGLLVDTGLISKEQKEHMLNWANGIRNNTIIPKQPGPYFKDTILPVGRPPIPEVRHDGLHHASPTNLVTYMKKITDMMDPIIEDASFNPVRRGNRNIFDITIDSVEGMADEIKSIIESFNPLEDLYMASFSDAKFGIIYNPAMKKTVDEFTERVEKLLNSIKPGTTRHLVLYIEAYNVRVEYHFDLKLIKPKPEDPVEFANGIKSAVNEFISNTTFENEVVVKGTTINATIDSTDISTDVDAFIEFLNSLDAKTINYKMGNTSVTLNIGDAESIESFKEGVIKSMPNSNGATTAGSVAAVSAAGNSVVYTLKVKYYNESECPVTINGTPYITMQDAINAAAAGDTIVLARDLDMPTAAVVEKDLVIELNGKALTISEDTIGDGVFHVTAGTLTINGDGTINGLGKNNYNMAIWADGGNVVINGGNYTNVGAGSEDHYDLIYAKGGVITINGGTFTCHTPKWTLNCKDNNGTIIVKGGSFTGYDPSQSNSENPTANFVADGYAVVETNGVYTVVEKSADEKIDEIMANIPEDSGVIVEEDPAVENTYNIVTSSAGISNTGIFDSIAAIDDLVSIHVTDGTSEVTFTAGGDLDAFKASVDALAPDANTDDEVILTMTVVTA